MDAHALLKSQGWRGKGHTLHHTSNSIGLAKPLLISRNTDGRGIGTNTHYTSDQWWLDAFDQKLKGLDTSKNGTLTQTVKAGKLDVIASGVKQGKYTGAKGLYACFVRGGLLDGTQSPEEEEGSGASTPVESRRESKEERRRMRIRKAEEKRIRKAEERRRRKEEKKVAKRAARLLVKAGETKEERRERRRERRARKEERRMRRGEKEGKNGSG
ncbi:hypothetical protein QBC44DRAFT_353695 [Cladorrhinum sp. PSN332]|nr:hypothetical protein QBC44DRAFT_353695 [Cladorrhinum sp. PSN332]